MDSKKIRKRLSKKGVIIENVTAISEVNMLRCLHVYKQDIYIRNAIEYCVNTMTQGGISIKVGQMSYPGIDVDTEKQINTQIKNFLAWYYLFGFVLFYYKKKEYKDKSSQKKANDENEPKTTKQVKNSNPKHDPKSVEHSKLRMSDMSGIQFDRIVSGISSEDVKNSDALKSMIDNDGLGYTSTINTLQYNVSDMSNSAFDRTSTSGVINNNNNNFKGGIGSHLTEDKTRIKVMTNVLLNDVKEIFSELNSQNGDLDFWVPEPTAKFAKFYRYTELGNPAPKIFPVLYHDPDNDSDYDSSSDSDSDDDGGGNDNNNNNNGSSGKPKKAKLDTKVAAGVLRNSGINQNTYMSASLLSPTFSFLPTFDGNYAYENHKSSEILISGTGHKSDEDNDDKKEKTKHKKKSINPYIYRIYTIDPPDDQGCLDSHVFRLINDYDDVLIKKKLEDICIYKQMYPAMIIQKTAPSKSNTGSKKIDEKSSGERSEDTYTNVTDSLVKKSLDSDVSNGNSSSSSYGTRNNGRKTLRGSEIIDSQKKLHIEMLREYNKQGFYSDMFRTHIIHEIPPQYSFDMNTVKIEQGYEYVQVNMPAVDVKYKEVEESYIKKVCSTFGVPRKVLFDSEEQQKWKSDPASENESSVAVLNSVRNLACDFFTSVFVTMNGYNFRSISQNINDFITTETKLTNILIEKIVQLTLKLPELVKKSQEEFIINTMNTIDQDSNFERNKLVLANLKMEVDKVIMKKQKQTANNPREPRFVTQTTTKTGGSGNGSGGTTVQKSKEQVEEPELPPIETNYVDSVSQDRNNERIAENNIGQEKGQYSTANSLKEYEKEKNLSVLHRFILFSMDALQKLEEVCSYVRKNRWMSVELVFNFPMMSIEALIKVNNLLAIQPTKLHAIVSAKYGFDSKST